MKNTSFCIAFGACVMLSVMLTGCTVGPIDYFGAFNSGSDIYQGKNGESFRAKIDGNDWYAQKRTKVYSAKILIAVSMTDYE